MIPKGLLNKEVKKPRLKLNPELVLICLHSTGPRSVKGEPASCQGHLTGPLDTYSVNIYKHISKVKYYFCIFYRQKSRTGNQTCTVKKVDWVFYCQWGNFNLT